MPAPKVIAAAPSANTAFHPATSRPTKAAMVPSAVSVSAKPRKKDRDNGKLCPLHQPFSLAADPRTSP